MQWWILRRPALINALLASTRQPLFHELTMAGHSQFKNIMHRKGKQDAARAKLFAKFARAVATRFGDRVDIGHRYRVG